MDSGIAHNLEQLSHWGVTQARLLAFQMGKPHPTPLSHVTWPRAMATFLSQYQAALCFGYKTSMAFPQGILLVQKVLYAFYSPRWEEARASGAEGLPADPPPPMRGRELKKLKKGGCHKVQASPALNKPAMPPSRAPGRRKVLEGLSSNA